MWSEHPLADAAPLIASAWRLTAVEADHLTVVSDAAGMLLWVGGRPALRQSAPPTR